MAANGGRKTLRGLGVLLALGLSVTAVLLIVFGKDAKTIRVGVLLGAWGLMFGGLSLYPRRGVPVVPAANAERARPATSTALEPRDEAAARREFERVLEAMLHRELDRGLRSELDSLRTEMAGLRGEVGQAAGNQVSLERVETRIVGADLADLHDEVRRRGPAAEPARLTSQPPAPNGEITEVIAAVRGTAPAPATGPQTSFSPAAPTSFRAPPGASAPKVVPTPTSRPAWSPSSVDLPSVMSSPPPAPPPPPRPLQPPPPPSPVPPAPTPVRTPVTPSSAPLGARRIPPTGPPRPTPPAPQPAPAAPMPVPQFAVPGPPVWTGQSSLDLTQPARPADSVVPRPTPPTPGNGTSLRGRSPGAPAPQEMRWPWQEEAKRASETAAPPLAPTGVPAVPSRAPAPPRPTLPTQDFSSGITRSDPFAGLPRLTPVSELDLPELLPDLPPPTPAPAVPWPAFPPVQPPPPAAGSAQTPGQRSDSPSDATPEADTYVGRRRAGY